MDKKQLKVQLVHDWLTGMRGGEKVLELLCQRFPEAPIQTLLHVPGSVSPLISKHEIRSSLLQVLPFSKTKYRHYLPVYPLLAELSKVRDADVVISTSHAVAKAMVKRNGLNKPIHICYIHTPMRYVWDRFDDYFGPHRVGSFLSRFAFKPLAKLLQFYDRKTVKRVDRFIANSSFVAQRVEKLYGRKADVIPPPVDLKLFENTKRNAQEWYLIVSALVPYKKVEDAILAVGSLGRKLKIIGQGPEEKNLRRLAQKHGAAVEFLGFVENEKLAQYYAQAKALLFPGVEDFGIVPVEALAAGCPVIAFEEGGVLDSLTPQTAVFYKKPNAEGLAQAILEFEKRTFDENTLKKRASEFSHENFLGRFEKVFNSTLDETLDKTSL